MACNITFLTQLNIHFFAIQRNPYYLIYFGNFCFWKQTVRQKLY